ncbi:hypothetical protein BDV24DRAFT_170429 [Aspergillus arachidicola]|uniref:CFEM domain-containing protein n=1 Tax=Aspergillus arachidicola TaxID=656916 RepID=A0A5N6XPZ5_9EURO|nr:hypothetical protein BDV24DRAFT_170429 [Aspergillus arachidicola]
MADHVEFLAQLPACAATCIVSEAQQSSCSLTDIKCICVDQNTTMAISKCIKANCTVVDVLHATNATYAACGMPNRDNFAIQVILPIVLGTIALMACFLKLASRIPFPSGLEVYDIVLAIAVAATIAVDAIDVVAARRGLRRDMWTIEPDMVDAILKCFYIAEPLYLIATDITKIAVLIFYLQVFPQSSFRILCHCIMAMCAAHLLAFILSSLFQCAPIRYSWEYWRGEHSGHCLNANIVAWAAAASNIALDLTILIMPLPLLVKLLMSMKQKILVLFLFSVGFVMTVVSVIRLPVLIRFTHSDNPTWDYLRVGYWSTIEINLSIICICMPGINHFIKKLRPTSLNVVFRLQTRDQCQRGNPMSMPGNRSIMRHGDMEHNVAFQW